tara:strand:+ start:105 stop:443 length:339 start_codon:yes stop_codon:yes gene_type:complete
MDEIFKQMDSDSEGDIAAKNHRTFTDPKKAEAYVKELEKKGLHVMKNKEGKTISITGVPQSGVQSGGMIGQSDMSAKKQKAPKKKKIPQYYKGGGKVKKNYAYGGRVAKYKG